MFLSFCENFLAEVLKLVHLTVDFKKSNSSFLLLPVTHSGSDEISLFLPIPDPLLDCPHVSCIFFKSSSGVRCKVVLGRPLFLFPSGVQWMATFAILSGSLHSTNPIYRRKPD